MINASGEQILTCNLLDAGAIDSDISVAGDDFCGQRSFSIIFRQTGCGWYVLLRNSCRIPCNHSPSPADSICANVVHLRPERPIGARSKRKVTEHGSRC